MTDVLVLDALAAAEWPARPERFAPVETEEEVFLTLVLEADDLAVDEADLPLPVEALADALEEPPLLWGIFAVSAIPYNR